MKMKRLPATPAMESFRLDLMALLERHAGALPAEQVLALAAQVVGQLIVYQDARRFTQAEIETLVSTNIVVGNRDALEAVIQANGGRQ